MNDYYKYYNNSNKSSDEYDLTLYEYFKEKGLPVVYTTVRKDETQIRCPFCGDSIKSSLSAHLYIKNRSPFPFYCQRCSMSGIVNSDFLLKLNFYDASINKYLNNSQREYQKKLVFKYGIDPNVLFKKKLIIKPNHYTKKEMKKLEYIESRIGIDNFFNKEKDLNKFNIILNLNDFLINNDFDMNNYSNFQKEKIKDLDNRYVMFLLNDKIMINAEWPTLYKSRQEILDEIRVCTLVNCWNILKLIPYNVARESKREW